MPIAFITSSIARPRMSQGTVMALSSATRNTRAARRATRGGRARPRPWCRARAALTATSAGELQRQPCRAEQAGIREQRHVPFQRALEGQRAIGRGVEGQQDDDDERHEEDGEAEAQHRHHEGRERLRVAQPAAYEAIAWRAPFSHEPLQRGRMAATSPVSTSVPSSSRSRQGRAEGRIIGARHLVGDDIAQQQPVRTAEDLRIPRRRRPSARKP